METFALFIYFSWFLCWRILQPEKSCRKSTNNAGEGAFDIFVYNFCGACDFIFTKIEFRRWTFFRGAVEKVPRSLIRRQLPNFFVPLINKLSCRLECRRIVTLVRSERQTFFRYQRKVSTKNCKIIHATLSLWHALHHLPWSLISICPGEHRLSLY